jgi:hypothetical protein
MTRHLTQLVVAAVLIVAAVGAWRTASSLRDQATHEERRLTLREPSDYWSGRYDAVAQAAGADNGDSLLLAANAAFRAAERDTGAPPAVERLDRVLQAYASALKNAGFNRDTAYNFEYVSRLRDAVAKSPRRTARPQAAPAAPAADDLPGGATLHGRPGTHPPPTKGEEFEVLTPMDYGEREAQPEPTPGRPLPRKG